MLAKLRNHISGNRWMYAIMLLSVCLNYWNIGFGAIQSIYPDETFFDLYAFKIIDYIRGNGIDYNLDPPVYSVCLAISFGCYYLYGSLTGLFHSLQDFVIHFSTHREDFIVIGRMVSAFFSVATIPFTYKIAERLFNKQVAVIAAAGLAFSYPMIWFAHTIHHTTISAFISAVILYFAVRVLETGKWKYYLLCGISVGVGIGVKLYPALFALSLAVVHFQRNPLILSSAFNIRNINRLIAAGMIAIITMIICYPWPFIENATWAESIKYSNVFFNGGNPFTNLYYVVWGKSAYYTSASAEPFSFWSNSLRILSETSLLVSIAAFLYVLFRYPSKWLLLFLPFVIFMVHHMLRGGLAMGARQFYFMLPVLYIGIGVLLNDMVIFVTAKSYRNKTALKFLLILLFFIQPVTWAIQYLRLTGNPTTQELGRNWLSNHLHRGDIILVNYAAPYSNIASWYLEQHDPNSPIVIARRQQLPEFTVTQLGELDYSQEIAAKLNEYQSVYVALSDYNSTVYYNYDNAKLWGEHKYHKFPQKFAYFSEIYRHSKKVIEFDPAANSALGPRISIYKIER